MSHLRTTFIAVLTTAALLTAAACLLPAAGAGAPPPRTCNSSDLRYYRERGQMGTTTIWFDYQIPNG